MKSAKDEKNAVITIDVDHNNSKPLTGQEESSTKARVTKKNVSNISTQRQLLSLARQFSLEGGLRSPEEQLPMIERVERHQQRCNIRRQQNLEAIIEQALAYGSEDEITEKADVDWFNNFILLAENIGNPTMQALWAKILAGEIARPGCFSLKALKVFREMSINDAKLLAKAHSLAVKDVNNINMRIISGCYRKPSLLSFFFGNKESRIHLGEFGLNYSDLLALSENNLIFIQEAETRPLLKNEQLHFSYHSTALSLAYKSNDVSLNFYKFTAIGNELAQLITDSANNAYFEHLKTQLRDLYLLN
jgi:uncharacterized repeat protein (TIGR03899 family)